MAYTVFNFVGFQAGWFACVLGAAAGLPWLGPLVVLVIAGANITIRREHAVELTLLYVIAAAVGYAVDSGLVLGGVLVFPPEAQLGGPSSLWMVALWVNLATTLNASLGWLRGRSILAAVFGAVGGPLAYFAGARLGAVTFGHATGLSLALVAIAWAAAMPALLWIAATIHRVVDRPDATPAAAETAP